MLGVSLAVEFVCIKIMQLEFWFSAGSSIANAEQRSILYTQLAKELDEKGAVFLKQGQTSQSLSVSDLFTLKDGTVMPVLKVI